MPIVVSGVALGIASVSEVGGKHLADTHQVCLPLRVIFFYSPYSLCQPEMGNRPFRLVFHPKRFRCCSPLG